MGDDCVVIQGHNRINLDISSMFTSATMLAPVEIRSAIVRDPLVVDPETIAIAAISRMSELRARCHAQISAESRAGELHTEIRSSCLVVMENGRVVGLVSERDVVSLCARQYSLAQVTIREVMTQPIVTLHESELNDLRVVIDLIEQHHLRHVPILDERGELVGIVTQTSLLYALQQIERSNLAERICRAPSQLIERYRCDMDGASDAIFLSDAGVIWSR